MNNHPKNQHCGRAEPMTKTTEINVLGSAQVSTHRKKYQVTLESTKDNPSISIYDYHDHNKATNSASISMLDAKYNGSNKMNREQMISLVRFLESKSGVTGFKNMTNWQRAIVLFNQRFISMEHNWEKFTTNVKRHNKNKWKYNKFKFALPIDLPMPDYSSL